LAIASPRHDAQLRFDTCATAPETQPLPTISCAHPPAMSTNCPAASDGEGARQFPGPSSEGRSAIALPQSPSPVAPSPGRFTTFRARHHLLCRSSNGVPASAGNDVKGQPAIAPPPPSRPCQRSNSDHAGKRYVLRRNRESRPGNAISQELTSLV